MFTIFIGIISILTVLGFTVLITLAETGVGVHMLVNIPAIVLTVFGTVAILFCIAPTRQLKATFWAVLGLFKPSYGKEQYRTSVYAVSRDRMASLKLSHPLIETAQHLWARTVSEDIFEEELGKRRLEIEYKHTVAPSIFRKLSGYPTQLAMTGTVLGLVAMLNNLSGDAKNIGPSMAMALIATFFGLVTTKMIVSPIKDRLEIIAAEQRGAINYIYVCLLQINRGEPIEAIGEVNDDKKA